MQARGAKAGILTRAWNWLVGDFAGDKAGPAPRSQSAFERELVDRHVLDGARQDRITDHWNPSGLTANSVHYHAGPVVRRRARDLVCNNPMANSAVDAYVANVIECGIIPRPSPAAQLSKAQRQAWQDEWDRWCEREADATGHQHFYELSGLWLAEVITAGGCITRRHTLSPRQMRNRTLPLTLDLLPEERFADDLDSFAKPAVPLEDSDGRKQAAGTRIIRGVEIDERFGRPVAYWLWRDEPDALFAGFDGYSKVRVPVEEASYAFLKHRTGQLRGLTLFLPAILWLYKLGYFVDNELTASAMKSCWAFMLNTTEIGDRKGLVDEQGHVIDAWGNPLEHFQPGMVFRGMPGDELKGVGPQTPSADSLPWIEMLERSVSIAAHLSRSEIFHDTGDSSFSAVRAENIGNRRRFTRMQWFTIWEFIRDVREAFVEACVMAGRPQFPSASEFAANRDEFLKTAYAPPTWESVTPKEDAEADEIHIRNRTKSRTQLILARGDDPEEVKSDLKQEEKDFPQPAAGGGQPGQREPTVVEQERDGEEREEREEASSYA